MKLARWRFCEVRLVPYFLVLCLLRTIWIASWLEILGIACWFPWYAARDIGCLINALSVAAVCMFFYLYRRLPATGCTELVQGCAEQGWLGGTRGPYRGGLRGLMGATLPTLSKVCQLSNTVGRYILNLEIPQSNPVIIQMFSERLWRIRAWKVVSASMYCLHMLFFINCVQILRWCSWRTGYDAFLQGKTI